jgi:hypothetical protein
MKRVRRLVSALPLVLAPASTAPAAVIHVPADQPTIGAAVAAASAGDEIVVACGTYLEHDIPIHLDLTVRGETGDPDCVTVDAGDLGRGFEIGSPAASVALEGLTITNARPPGTVYEESGGAVIGRYVDLTIRHCRFVGNEAPLGTAAGVGHLGAALVVEDSEFLGNTALHSVALQSGDSGEPLEVTRCRFADNEATLGETGAVGVYAATATFTDCVFERNGGSRGGAVGGQTFEWARLEGCRFEENHASERGGAVSLGRAAVTIEGCEFLDNTAGMQAGALRLRVTVPGHEALVSHSSFEGNTSADLSIGLISTGPALVRCCFTDPLVWETEEGGTIVFDDEGCSTALESSGWSGIKVLYR